MEITLTEHQKWVLYQIVTKLREGKTEKITFGQAKMLDKSFRIDL
jgi:hypothetical protein